MTIQAIFWSIAAVAVLIVLPIAMIWSVIEHFKTRASERQGSGGISAGIGAAMLELDRLMTRPSVEHQIEAEQNVLTQEDEKGGD